MYCATVVNFTLKVWIVNDLLGKFFLAKNPLILSLCQKPKMEKYDFPEKVPFRTSLNYASVYICNHFILSLLSRKWACLALIHPAPPQKKKKIEIPNKSNQYSEEVQNEDVLDSAGAKFNCPTPPKKRCFFNVEQSYCAWCRGTRLIVHGREKLPD